MRFAIEKDAGGSPTWRLYGGNGRMVAWAGESFDSAQSAQRAATAFKARAASARFEVYVDAGGSYRWRAWRESDQVACSGEAFSNRPAAQTVADDVRDNAISANF